MKRDDLSTALKAEARRLGFDLVGIAPAVTPDGIHDFLDWIERGYAGQMQYLERREAAYHHPRNVLDGVRSVVMLGINYNTQPNHSKARTTRIAWDREEASSAGQRPSMERDAAPRIATRVARYAQGCADYHDVIRDKLRVLADFLRREAPGCKARGIVDTAPLLERDF